jgi:hypothetical protein
MSGPDPMFKRDMGQYVEEPPITHREVIIGGLLLVLFIAIAGFIIWLIIK